MTAQATLPATLVHLARKLERKRAAARRARKKLDAMEMEIRELLRELALLLQAAEAPPIANDGGELP